MITNIFPYFFPFKPKFSVPLELKYLYHPRRAYYIYRQKRSETAPWVVLLHGWLLDSSKMDSRLQYYVNHGFNALLIDARSHGRSQFTFNTHPLLHVYDAYEIIQYEGIQAYIAHGVSYGALSALKLATIDHRNIGLVLEAMPFSFSLLMKDLVRNIGILKYISLIAIFVITLLRKDVIEEVEPKHLLEQVFVPSFIIIGEKDPIVREPQVKAYKSLLHKLTWTKLWIVPGSDHTGMVNQFEYPFKLLEFLESVLFYHDRFTFTVSMRNVIQNTVLSYSLQTTILECT